MKYFRNTIWEKRLPAFSGIFVLLFAIGITVLLSRNTALFVTKATVGSVPKDIQVSNISDTSFTVSYTTDQTATGVVAYGTAQSLGDVALDERDQQTGKPTEYRVHFITIKNLSPASKYYYTITSGTQTVTNGDAPYEVTTAAADAKQPAEQTTLTGIVALDNGTFPTEGIVSVSTNTSQVLAALISPDGTYKLPLTPLRSKDVSTYLALMPNDKLNLKINSSDLQSAATLLYSQAANVPRMVLSKTYDFTLNPDPLTSLVATDSAQIATKSAGFPVFDQIAPVTAPEITSPTNAQQLKDQQPLFKGRALPSADIEITINSSKEITAKLQSDSNGVWEFRPPIALDPGKHTISIKSLDASGIMQTVTNSFTVYAAGSQFVEPSISPVEVSPTIPITPTLVALPSPTITPSPTEVATPSASPTLIVQPTRGTLDPTGSSSVVIGIVGAVLAVGIGALLFFFTIV
jgi:hypothetical protein